MVTRRTYQAEGGLSLECKLRHPQGSAGCQQCHLIYGAVALHIIDMVFGVAQLDILDGRRLRDNDVKAF
jgi:hypothetical protein